ncbi:MAG: cation transporting ATPase C-terminal domain-containing protein, partial [Candidatus Obscuribacterales bacterium]|nr:cation transporting ATPase C-terminal domain-containing protein [Candidatus Obscuribacterales bacterium]
NFSSIVNAIEEGRAVFANIRKFLTYVLSSNVAELIPCLAFVLFKIPLPLSVMQILSIDLGTDLLPALALGTEQPDPYIMSIPPRARNAGLFDWKLLCKAYLYLGAMVSISSMAAFFYILNSGGWHYGEIPAADNLNYRAATTACLMGIMCMQIVNASMCRSDRKSIFSVGIFSNSMLNLGIFFEILLMGFISYSPLGNAIFHTAPLPISFWLFMIPFMIAMTSIEELRKLILRIKTAPKGKQKVELKILNSKV